MPYKGRAACSPALSSGPGTELGTREALTGYLRHQTKWLIPVREWFQALSQPRLPVWTQVAEIKGPGELPGLITCAEQAGSPFRSATVGGGVSA